MKEHRNRPRCPTCNRLGEEVTTSVDDMRLFVCPNGHRLTARSEIVPDDEGADDSTERQ